MFINKPAPLKKGGLQQKSAPEGGHRGRRNATTSPLAEVDQKGIKGHQYTQIFDVYSKNMLKNQLHFFLKDGGRDEADIDSDGVAHKQNNLTTLRRFALQHARSMIILR